MANQPVRKFEDNLDDFQRDQTSTVEKLFNANPNEVDVEEAKKLGLISDETQADIEKLAPFFKAALNREKRQAGTAPVDAFKRAFEVYGRVLFAEAEANPDVVVAEKLSKDGLLKTPIKKDGKVSLKGRHELIAVLRRLKATPTLERGKVIDMAFKAETGAGIKKLEREHEEAETRQKSMRTTYEYFAHSENIVGFLEKQNAYGKVVNGALDKLKNNESDESSYELTESVDIVTTTSGDVEPVYDNSKKEPKKNKAHKSFYEKRTEAAGNLATAKGELERLHAPGSYEVKNYMDAFKYAKSTGQAIPTPVEAMKTLTDDYTEKKGDYAKAKAQYEEESRVYETVFTFADQLYTELKKLVQNVEAAHKLGIKFGYGFDADKLVADFKTHELKSTSFDPIKFMEFSEGLRAYFGDPKKVEALQKAFDEKFADAEKTTKAAKKELDVAKKVKEKTSDLTDAQAAKKIMETVLLKKFPDMTAEDRAKMATMILAEDVMRLQQAGTYEEIAREGSAEFLDTVKLAGFREKLIGFEFKVGDKVTQPFKGLKPSDFADLASIEKLFTSGRLNHQNGFFALAALELFEGGAREGVVSLQSVTIRKKLKVLLAKKMGVEDNLSDSRVAKIVNRAFDEQLEHVRPLVRTYFEAHNKGAGGFTENKVKELNTRMKKLHEERKLGKVSNEVFKKQKDDLLKEAKEFGLADKIEFSEDSVVADWFASPDSEWLRGTGDDIGKWFGAKGKGLASGTLNTALAGAWGATKLGVSLGWQTAVMMPLRALKYAGIGVAKPLVGAINLFRRSKWTPLPGIRETVRADAGRALAYTKENTVGTVQRAYGATGANLKKGWATAPDKHKPYKERTKVNLEALDADITEASARAKASAVEVADSPYLSLDKYVKELKALGLDAEVPKAPAEQKEEKHEEAKKPEAEHGHGDSHHKKAA